MSIQDNENSQNNCQKVSTIRLGPALVLLLLLYLSLHGQYVTEFDFSISVILALINLILITIILTVVPFIFRLINKKILDYKKGRIICITNSIVMFILSIISLELIGISFIGGLGALIYYFINMFLFVEQKFIPEKVENTPYIYNPKLSSTDNLKEQFNNMNILMLKNLIDNKKDEYTEEAYQIALEQYNLRKSEASNIVEQEKLKADIVQYTECLEQLNHMLKQAKKDLGDLTTEEVENMYRLKLISTEQRNQMINSIEVLQTIVANTPESIKITQQTITELEKKLEELQQT